MNSTQGGASGGESTRPSAHVARWRAPATVAGLAVLVGLATTHPARESDAYWHMTQGRAVLESGARTLPDPVALQEFSQPLSVPEWLWDVSVYLLHETVGWAGLSVWVALLAATMVVGLWHLGRTLAPRMGIDLWLLVVGPACVLALARLRLRPQTAFFALLPWMLSLSYRFREAHEPRDRLRLGSLLAAGTLLWAQLHGSFVIAPVLVGLITLPMWRDPDTRRALLWLALAMALSALTTSHGTDVVGYVLAHGAGDASLYIEDIASVGWANFDPTRQLYGPLYLGGALACLLVMVHRRRLPRIELLLALFGVAMGLTMARLFVVAGVLLVPLALRALEGVEGFDRRRYAFAAGLTAVLLGLHVDRVMSKRGPLLHPGPQPGRHPQLAAAYLGALESPQRILSSFDAGGALGFLLFGKARTFVDARTPAFFDETDFAVARDGRSSQAGLVRLARLHHATSVVTERNSGWCEGAIAGGLVPAVAGPTFTTLVHPDDAPLEPMALLPCGPERLPADACQPDKRRALETDIERHARLGSPALTALLRASLVVRCDGARQLDPAALPAPEDSLGFRIDRDLLLAEAWITQGKPSEAVELLVARIDTADPRLLDFVERAHHALPPSLARSLLTRMFDAYRDTSPTWILLGLAHHAMAAGDAVQARFFAFRCAVRGEPRVLPVLHWLGAEGADARAREQARDWMQTLTRELEQPPEGASDGP